MEKKPKYLIFLNKILQKKKSLILNTIKHYLILNSI